MKKILIAIACLLPMMVIGQTPTENYVKTTAYQVAVDQGQEDNLAPSQKIESIGYVDGLGRPKQSIGVRAGGDKQNIITYTEYDDLGRTPKQYLPYATLTEVTNPLELVDPATVKTNIEAFYNTAKYENTLNPYSEMVYEPSPLNRVTEQAAPGNSWALSNNHTIKMDYQTNAVNEVRYFDVAFTGGNTTTPIITLSGYYNPAEVYKSVTKDENWTAADGLDHTIEEFTNKQGQVILKRTYEGEQAHDTYYVYDDFGNLTFVLSPEGSQQIVNGGVLVSNDQDILDRLCYQYRYDYRNRLIEKKVPGKGWEYIFYDVLDRPVLTQDTRLRENNQFLFTKYDALSRVLYTGIYQATAGTPNATVQNTISAQSSVNETRTASATTIGSDTAYYSNGVFPTSNVTVHTVNYYDTYEDHTGITLPATVYGASLTTQTQGLPTVSKVRVLGHNEWITTVTGYDEKARPVFRESSNTYLNTEDTSLSKLDFIGNVVETKTTHQKNGHPVITTTDFFTYDHQNRLLTHMQQLDTDPVQLITSNVYDEMGQLETKYVGGKLFESGYTDLTAGRIEVSEDNIITKTAGGSSYNAGLATAGSLEGDGSLSFINLTENKRYIVGFNDMNQYTNSTGEIEYAFLFGWNNPGRYRVRIRENNTTSYITGYVNYYANDHFSIEREGNVLSFIQNGSTVATYTMTQNFPSMEGDMVMADEGAQISNLTIYDTAIDQSLQKVDYAYNVRGWLTDINPASATNELDLFSFQLYYDEVRGFDQSRDASPAPLYNGNIAQTVWSTSNIDTQERSYAYTYDALNRITKASSGKGTDFNTEDAYSLGLVNYDQNGNITTLRRDGDTGQNSATLIDNLTYTYVGNQLQKVTDATAHTEGFKDGAHTGNDYAYDSNGNMTEDKNKGITNIVYNHLNLPTSVIINDLTNQNGTITYIYDATGIKLEKVVVDNTLGITKSISYAGGYIYEATGSVESLQLLAHPEGYIEPSTTLGGTAYEYAFNYTDHLGNVRMTYADSNHDGTIDRATEIISEKHYYPYGLKHKGYNDALSSNSNSSANKFQYNGKEIQDELGYNTYDFGARNYDPTLGRWFNIDPFADQMRRHSPYNYAFDNPIYYIDPDGMMPFDFTGDNKKDDNFDARAGSNYITTTYVDRTGKIIHHENDGRDGIYLVLHPENGLNKYWLIGRERRGQGYVAGEYLHKDDLTPFYQRTGLPDGFLVQYDLDLDDKLLIAWWAEWTSGANSTRLLKFRGLVQNRLLRNLTHQQLVNAFKGTGLKLSNHAVKRLKDARLEGLGVKTLNDLKQIVNKGVRFDAGSGDVGVSYKGVEIIISPDDVVITVRPAKKR